MRTIHLLLLGLCLFLFTSFATTDLALPGPQGDEVWHAALTLDLLRPMFPFSRDYPLRIGDQPFPFGINPHTGALKGCKLWPLFALFGPSVELGRLFTIFLGLLTLLFCYGFISEQVGQWEAFWVTLLLSLDNSFIFYSKLDAGPIMEELLWVSVCLYFFGRFHRSGRLCHLGGGSVAAILGIYSHITFVWFVVAGLLGALSFFPKKTLGLFKKPALYVVVPAAVSFLTIFLYWLIGDRKFLGGEPPGAYGIFVMFERLSTRGGILPDVLLGRLTKEIVSIPGIHARPLTDVFLMASILFLVYFRRNQTKLVRFLACVAGVILLQLSVTPQGFATFNYTYHRMMLLYIFLIFFAGIAVSESAKHLRHFKSEFLVSIIASFAILLLAVASIGGQISFTQEAIRKVRQTGGEGIWSDKVYALAETVQEEKWEKIVCLNWGLFRSIFVLTNGEVPLRDAHLYWRMEEEVRRQRLSQLMRDSSPHTLFLFVPGRAKVTLQKLKEAAEVNGRELHVEHLFYDRQGDPLYVAYTVHPKHP